MLSTSSGMKCQKWEVEVFIVLEEGRLMEGPIRDEG
jgi:hypothetical protein